MILLTVHHKWTYLQLDVGQPSFSAAGPQLWIMSLQT